LLVTAWLFVLLGTLTPMIVAEELIGSWPSWLIPVQFVPLGGFLALTVRDAFRDLRPLALALLAGYGTWNVSVAWLGVVGIEAESLGPAWFTLATDVLQGLFVVGLLLALLADGASREDLFLRVGDPLATASREWLPGFRRERPWWRAALLWGGLPGAILLVHNTVAGNYPGAGTLVSALPVIVLSAAINAFSEEFVYRTAPLAGLVEAVGKRHALVLLGAFFGLSHYYGSPGGLTGVAMTAFYGWLLAKSIFETRGLGVAFAIHVTADVLVFTAYLG
jgi:membrane protease YdiL (CAAX protease family)